MNQDPSRRNPVPPHGISGTLTALAFAKRAACGRITRGDLAALVRAGYGDAEIRAIVAAVAPGRPGPPAGAIRRRNGPSGTTP
jgi:hypothetical protein